MTGPAWILHTGMSPTGQSGWLVHREDQSGPLLVFDLSAFDEARMHLVRRAFEDDVDAFALRDQVDGSVVRERVDR